MVILEILGWSFKYLYSVCGLSVNKGGNECFDSVCFCWGGVGGGVWSCIVVTEGETGGRSELTNHACSWTYLV